jgi:hypothetical protein
MTSSYAVYAGIGEIFVISCAGGVVAGDKSALIRHLRHAESVSTTDAVVYVKRPGASGLEECVLGTNPMSAPRMDVDRCTEIYTVNGQFICTVVWASKELSKATI